jgi:hypothetical protein
VKSAVQHKTVYQMYLVGQFILWNRKETLLKRIQLLLKYASHPKKCNKTLEQKDEKLFL